MPTTAPQAERESSDEDNIILLPISEAMAREQAKCNGGAVCDSTMSLAAVQ